MAENRIKNYVRSLGSAYFLLVVNIVYSLATVPLALSFLGKQVFGLWALTVQIVLVLQLTDAGMRGALMRILIDHKDDKTSPAYRQTLYTVWLAMVCIAAIAAGVAYSLKLPLIDAFGIPADLRLSYASFLGAFLILFAGEFLTKPISLVLGAHQRNDLVSATGACGLMVSFGVLVVALRFGAGLWAFLWAQMAASIFVSVVNGWQALRLGYLPRFHVADCAHLGRFKEVAAYGWQRVVATFGYTALLTMPAFAITRWIGLEATAAWTVGTRVQQLVLQMTSKVSETAYPAFAEMYVRGEHATLGKRFTELMTFSIGLSCILAVTLAATNNEFIALWTGGRVVWWSTLDVLLALMICMVVLQKLFWIPVSIAKNLGISRYMTLFEAGLAYAVIMWWPRDGLNLVVVASVLLAAGCVTSLPVYIHAAVRVLDVKIGRILALLAHVAVCLMLPLGLWAWFVHLLLQADTWVLLLAKALIISSVGALLCFLHPSARDPVLRIVGGLMRRKCSVDPASAAHLGHSDHHRKSSS
jgi:O-antigen/teichoic acid export membrane protein